MACQMPPMNAYQEVISILRSLSWDTLHSLAQKKAILLIDFKENYKIQVGLGDS